MSDDRRPPGVVNMCPRCGQPVPEGAAVCPNCGAAQQDQSKQQDSWDSQPPGVPGRPQQPGQPKAPTPPGPQRFENVSFWPRVLAWIIDNLVMAALQAPIVVAFILAGTAGIEISNIESWQSPEAQKFFNLLSIPFSIIQIAYYTIMNGTWGATLGKMALGMKIVRDDGSPISYGIALGRIIIKLILAQCTCSLMYLSVATNDEHRGWHDQIIGTRVIYDR